MTSASTPMAPAKPANPRRSQAGMVCVNRKALLAALSKVAWLASSRSAKPILRGVRLQATGGQLQLAATDLETGLVLSIECEGELTACVAACQDLVRRIKAGKARECTLAHRPRRKTLCLNGGSVEHALPTMPADEFPLVRDQVQGSAIRVPADVLRSTLATVISATAREPSRYAIDGVLLECDADGARLVGTDGRRLAICELGASDVQFRGSVILPRRLCECALKQIDPRKPDDAITVAVKVRHASGDRVTTGTTCAAKAASCGKAPGNPPGGQNTATGGPGSGESGKVDPKPPASCPADDDPAEIFIAGPGWIAWSMACDGMFPMYRDVVPPSRSRFVANREQMIEALTEVAQATTLENKGVRVDFGPRSIRLTVRSGDGESSGSVRCKFVGDASGDSADSAKTAGTEPGIVDDRIITAFEPRFLLDALRSLPGPDVCLDLGQNRPSTIENDVIGQPMLVYDVEHSHQTRWVIMPIRTGLSASRETLGSNYPEPETAPEAAPEMETEPAVDASRKGCLEATSIQAQ